MNKKKSRTVQLLLASVALSVSSLSIADLSDCADQFIGGDINNAPTLYDSEPSKPYGSNKHLCYQDDDASFFAVEYWPEQYAPRWAAYKLNPDNYGTNACKTFTRAGANCYFKKNTWEDYVNCDSNPGDPFHTDYVLAAGEKLGPNDFGNTGHDRGHIAPRQAFSWHICATYQTFTMANMSSQRAFLNQNIWQYLERQVLTWSVDEGPIYVVSGATYDDFPTDSFQVFKPDKSLSTEQVYKKDYAFDDAVGVHHDNFTSFAKGEFLRPKRDATPEKVKDVVKSMKMPTGYFKVLYRPKTADTEEQAIGFLMPHSFENLNLLTDKYPKLATSEVFWSFVAQIDLIEQVSGIRFPGVPKALKSQWGNAWFKERAGTGRNISAGCTEGEPAGILANSTKDERLAACTDQLITN